MATCGRMLLEIHGHHFPGRTWHVDGEPCGNVHVGVQVRREPQDLVPGDSETAVWIVPIDVTEQDGGVDFRGLAVQGRRGERFVYLTWGHLHDDERFTMFRRAKLMLADVECLLAGDRDIRVMASVHLTDECGGPRCARLRPPALTLTVADGDSGAPATAGRVGPLDDPLPLLRGLCLALPETTERLSHGEPTWFVRDRKTFVTYADHHHDDRLGFWCAAPPGVQENLVAASPERFFRPPYVGHRGWLGVYLDVLVDWDDVAEIVTDAWRTVAPRQLVARFDAP